MPPDNKEPSKTRVRPWGEFRNGERIVILGLPMTGKSYFAASLTKNADRVIFFDPMSDYASYAGAKPVTLSDLEENAEILSRPRFRIAIIPSGDDYESEVADTVRIAEATGNLLLVFDEVGDYRKQAEHILNRVSRTGRHQGIVPVYVSQVATDIPLTVRRIATRVFSFYQYYERDLTAIAEVYGEEFANRVRNLNPSKREMAKWTLPTLSVSLKQSESSLKRKES